MLEGFTEIELPDPAEFLPPQVPLYHLQVAPGERVPCTVNTVVFPLHNILLATDAVMPEGVQEAAVTEIVTLAQLEVPQTFSALAK